MAFQANRGYGRTRRIGRRGHARQDGVSTARITVPLGTRYLPTLLDQNRPQPQSVVKRTVTRRTSDFNEQLAYSGRLGYGHVELD